MRGVDHLPHPVPRLKKEYRYTCIPCLGIRCLLQDEFYVSSVTENILVYLDVIVCREVGSRGRFEGT